jgi:septum formation protein
MEIVLASASPRREQLLRWIVPQFDVIPSGVAEPERGRPAQRVLDAARLKAREVSARASGIVIGADTMVVQRRRVLGKPASRQEAAEMLRRLSGRWHDVFTGLCVIDSSCNRECTAVEMTRVRFRPLSEREISHYLDCGEYVDKAGAYAIQGRAAAFIDRIRGEVTNVIGLPVPRLALLLRDLGVDV